MLVDYLQKECLVFKVYGFADIKKKASGMIRQSVSKKNTSGLDSSGAIGEQSTQDVSNGSGSMGDSNSFQVYDAKGKSKNVSMT